jgi:23S rRNA pseudouridine1911/1915/1917 synthase
MAKDQIFRVAVDQADMPVLKALRAWLPGQSWAKVRELLDARRVMVSGNLCLDEGRRLKVEEVVKVLAHPLAAPPKDEDVKIRFLDAHVVVVEKPGGMTSIRHPEERKWPARRRQLQPTLDEVLPKIVARKEKRAGKGNPPRLRAVHRLDRETSGLMVFARTVPAERALGMQFRAHSLDRHYLAVVVGQIEGRTIQSYLVEDRGDGKRGSGAAKLGKKAVTHVKPLEYLDGYTLVECRLETGRTHQIRIHLAEAGHPVCGDKVYHGPYAKSPILDLSGAPRLALHAAELGFVHPATAEEMTFTMSLPPDLEQFLRRLRR